MPPSTVSRPWLGWAVVALSIVSNILVKVINFSDGEYDTPELSVRAIMNVALGLVYAVCALIAWQLLPTRLVGWLMAAVSVSWQAGSWLRTVGEVDWLWPIVAGLTNLWAILVGILVFCYPTGRVVRVFDRVIIGVALTLFAVRFALTILVTGRERDECTCSVNAFAVAEAPDLLQAVEYLWQLVGLGLIVLVAVRVIVRWFASSPPARRVAFVMPIALILWTAASLYEIGGRLVGADVLPGLFFVTPLTISSIPVAFVAGIFHVRGLRSRVSDLVIIARDGVDRVVWQSSLRRTLDDPLLRVFWWDDETGGYLNSENEPENPAASAEGRPGGSLLSIDAGDRPLAVINHDSGLTENTRLLDAVAAALRLSVDNDQLRSRLEHTLIDVRESRLRILEAGDSARRRIERDLHDGSQQQLVSVAINLRMIGAEATRSGDARVGEQLQLVSAQLAEALTDLRRLARGIHPAALTEGGLAMAVRELAARCPVPVDVAVDYHGEASALTESTIYFVVAECLTNTAKHAEASRASVHIRQLDDVLEFAVADDGRGRVDPNAGSGIRGLIDRVEALGGQIVVSSAPGEGTSVVGSMPMAVAQPSR
ncbi:MAG: hypothetical protein RI885_241 [Actinomycetota bacterium]